MGRGGGGGRGGGTRKGRSGGGGGVTTPIDVAPNGVMQLPIGTHIDPDNPIAPVVTPELQDIVNKAALPENQLASAYDDLPPVENANRYVDSKGIVHVGDKGAIDITEADLAEFPTPRDAYNYLVNEVGFPRDSEALANLKQIDGLATVAALSKGTKYFGEGIEGAVVKTKDGVILRVQHTGSEPLPAYDMGKVGVYADWKKKYGQVWVEAKESIAMNADFLPAFGIDYQKMQKVMERNMQGKVPLHKVDDHGGNWGIDYKGRTRVIDPGAYRGPGDNEYAVGWKL